ncbi:MAG: alkaline phosphatase family protein [Coriobacteriia bacterium]
MVSENDSTAAGSASESAVPMPAKARSRLRWVLLIAGIVAALGISYSAMQLADYSWTQVVDYDSPFVAMPTDTFTGARPPLDMAIPDATPRRTVLVLIDGLTDETSRKMDSIEKLRASGADVRLTIPQPSLSYPTWTTIFTGATPQISGVTTNWYEKRVEVESLFDVAAGSGRALAVSGPDDLDLLYGVSALTTATALVEWGDGEYQTDVIVDGAIDLAAAHDSDFIVALFPDVDEAGHSFGSASAEYADVAAKVDADLGRLVAALDDGDTVFVVLPDHGHIARGGHGGWEAPVIHTFAAFSGPGVEPGTAEALLEDIAPTVAVLAGLQAPSHAKGLAIDAVLDGPNGRAQDADFVRSVGFTLGYARELVGQGAVADLDSIGSVSELDTIVESAETERLATDRADRLPMALGLALAALAILAVVGIASWRALAAAGGGAVTYFLAYNASYFLLHGYRWSLSAFNEETMVQAFFNGRMIDAVVAGLIACFVAGEIYLMLRPEPKGTREGFTVGWLSLGVATTLTIQALLAMQVAWFLWQWGAATVWRLPDLRWGFKYDLDLIQITALAGAAILGPVVTYLLGRYHPRVARAK